MSIFRVGTITEIRDKCAGFLRSRPAAIVKRISACSVAQNVIKALQITAQARIRARGSNNQNTREIPRAWRDIARSRSAVEVRWMERRNDWIQGEAHSLLRPVCERIFISLKTASPVAAGFWQMRMSARCQANQHFLGWSPISGHFIPLACNFRINV